jgi:hypothetical protein
LLIILFTVAVFQDHCLLAWLFGCIVCQRRTLRNNLSTTDPPLLGPWPCTCHGHWWENVYLGALSDEDPAHLISIVSFIMLKIPHPPPAPA